MPCAWQPDEAQPVGGGQPVWRKPSTRLSSDTTPEAIERVHQRGRLAPMSQLMLSVHPFNQPPLRFTALRKPRRRSWFTAPGRQLTLNSGAVRASRINQWPGRRSESVRCKQSERMEGVPKRSRIHCLRQNYTKPFISQWFRHPATDDPYEPELNRNCSTANPSRQVAASNGMVCSTMGSSRLFVLLTMLAHPCR